MTELERVHAVVERARDALTVGRVYGEPIEHDGTIVIPAAAVAGGAGGGSGTDQHGNAGGGHGFGMRARPVGAFVIRQGDVRWEPVVDRERQAMIGALVATMALLTIRSLARRRRRHR